MSSSAEVILTLVGPARRRDPSPAGGLLYRWAMWAGIPSHGSRKGRYHGTNCRVMPIGRSHVSSVDLSPPLFVILFPLFFVALWLAITALLALPSGWLRLRAKFPDQKAKPALRLSCQSGTMGSGVHIRGALNLSVCSSGLRIGVMRLFGPFCRDFFVPWESIGITRRKGLLGPVVDLQFGNPVVGTLSISGNTADRLAAAAAGRWPESPPFFSESARHQFRRLLPAWALASGCAAISFVIVSLVVAPASARPPIAIAILLPAIFFGLVWMVRFFRTTNFRDPDAP
jgi:hypothetical protein